MLLGFSVGQKGWKILELEIEKVTVSRNVQFQENIFPFEGLEKEGSPPRLQAEKDSTEENVVSTLQ